MWRKAALKRLEQGRGTFAPRPQFEINRLRDENLKELQSSSKELESINKEFYRLAGTKK